MFTKERDRMGPRGQHCCVSYCPVDSAPPPFTEGNEGAGLSSLEGRGRPERCLV